MTRGQDELYRQLLLIVFVNWKTRFVVGKL